MIRGHLAAVVRCALHPNAGPALAGAGNAGEGAVGRDHTGAALHNQLRIIGELDGEVAGKKAGAGFHHQVAEAGKRRVVTIRIDGGGPARRLHARFLDMPVDESASMGLQEGAACAAVLRAQESVTSNADVQKAGHESAGWWAVAIEEQGRHHGAKATGSKCASGQVLQPLQHPNLAQTGEIDRRACAAGRGVAVNARAHPLGIGVRAECVAQVSVGRGLEVQVIQVRL